MELIRVPYVRVAGRRPLSWGPCARLLLVALMFGVAGCEPTTGTEPVAAQAPTRAEADLILTHAVVHTLDDQRTRAEALAIRDGAIVAVGSTAEVSANFVGPTRDLGGAMVLPGFHDAHAHPLAGGIQLGRCDLTEADSIPAILARLHACESTLAPGAWLLGGGWNLALFPEANADKALLDGVSSTRPIFLKGADGHSSWVNQAALAAAGISADTPNPERGIIERYRNGEPSGTLRESAQNLVEAVLPPVTDLERSAGALVGLALANAFGITSFVEAAADADTLATWRALEADGRLSARIVASVHIEPGSDESAALALLEPASRDDQRLIRADAAKLFIDGVLEGETAALLEPYEGRQGASGALIWSWEALRDRVVRLDAQGIQVHMHAIGDRAVREGLDALEAARQANGPRDNRPHIAHLQLVHPEDYGRFAALGVTANFQALWAFPDPYIVDVNTPAVGQARVDRMYPIASIARADGRIVLGSDWFVSSMNPLLVIETAVTRKDPSGRLDGVLNGNEAITLDAALAAYTREGAWLMHQDHRVGTLEVGKRADLVVLERDLYAIDPSEIGEVAVLLTLFDGRVVHERGGATGQERGGATGQERSGAAGVAADRDISAE